MLESRHYPAPYPQAQHCLWTITPWPNHRIQFTIEHLDILPADKCKTDYLKLQHGHFHNQRRLCGHLAAIQYYIGEATEVRFRSKNDENIHHSGFRVSFRQVPEKDLTTLELEFVLVNGKYVRFKKRYWLQFAAS